MIQKTLINHLLTKLEKRLNANLIMDKDDQWEFQINIKSCGGWNNVQGILEK